MLRRGRNPPPVLLLLLFALFPSVSHARAKSLHANFSIAAYLPEWRYESANWESMCEYSTHLILFSLEIGSKGEITALDRIPAKDLLSQARDACSRHGTALLICFGGNGRSNGFSKMVRSDRLRANFVAELVKLCETHGFDGVDYNWEYPGYIFGRGYLPESEVIADYKGLEDLLKDTRQAFQGRGWAITMAYYPDSRQEALLAQHNAAQHADLLHMMSYDQNGKHHSTFKYATQTVRQGIKLLPAEKLTLGLPFYGRHTGTGDWTTYEDIVQNYAPLNASRDFVPAVDGSMHKIGFNGIKTIKQKTKYAIKNGLGGVMIWEIGQDCRLIPVTYRGKTHVRTCPRGENSSLSVAIHRAMRSRGVDRVRRKVLLEQNEEAREL